MTHRRITTREDKVKIDWPELKKILLVEARRQAGYIGSFPDDVNLRIDIKQLEEGSPSYRVSKWSVTIVHTSCDDDTLCEKESGV